MNSQVDLNMTKASNFTENHRNRKEQTKPYDPGSCTDTDVNVLLSQNNYLRLGITYPTGHFCKDNWLVHHKNQATLIKSSKSASAVLLGDSIVAAFLRYPNIWYKFCDENTIKWNWWRQDSKHIMESGKHPFTTIAGVRCNQLWHEQPGYRRF